MTSDVENLNADENRLSNGRRAPAVVVLAMVVDVMEELIVELMLTVEPETVDAVLAPDAVDMEEPVLWVDPVDIVEEDEAVDGSGLLNGRRVGFGSGGSVLATHGHSPLH